LKNDYKCLMNQLQDSLNRLHDCCNKDGQDFEITDDNESATRSLNTEPFLIVTGVDEICAGRNAGFIEGDLIVIFGPINCENFTSNSDIAQIVSLHFRVII
ncbi:MAG: 26S proteasome non-ATPase regulatory subunit 9, partial [Paramarteilia canceri]